MQFQNLTLKSKSRGKISKFLSRKKCLYFYYSKDFLYFKIKVQFSLFIQSIKNCLMLTWKIKLSKWKWFFVLAWKNQFLFFSFFWPFHFIMIFCFSCFYTRKKTPLREPGCGSSNHNFCLAAQASSLLIHFCDLLDTCYPIVHHSHFLLN